MSWIALIIVISLIGYTVITLTFRKPESESLLPYEESQIKNDSILQLGLLGWDRLQTSYKTLSGENEPQTDLAVISTSPAPSKLDKILPMDLVMVMPGRPKLVTALEKVLAPTSVQQGATFIVSIRLSQSSSSEVFSILEAYRKETDIYLFPLRDKASGDSGAINDIQITLSQPKTALTPGPYNLHLYTGETIYTWELQVTENNKTPSIDVPAK